MGPEELADILLDKQRLALFNLLRTRDSLRLSVRAFLHAFLQRSKVARECALKS
jgi:hypothetical protein